MRFLKIFTLHAQHVFQYRLRNFVWFLNSLINPLVLLMFWKGILKPGHVQNGWTNESIQSYYLLLIVGLALLIHHVELMVGYYEIKQGNLVQSLLRPYSHLKLRFISESPWRLIQGFYGCISLIILYLFFGLSLSITSDPIMLGTSMVIMVLAFFLSFIVKMVVGLTAFWLTNIDGLLEFIDVLFIMFAGMIIPINLFPDWLAVVAYGTPFPYMLYYPIASIVGVHTETQLIQIITMQLVWIGLFTSLYVLMWNKGLKKFSGVGQ